MATTTESLYDELKPDISALVEPMFDLGENLVRKRGNFLPYGSLLLDSNEVRFIAAAPASGNDLTNSEEVLPSLHDALRAAAGEQPTKAIGIAEDVTVTRDGHDATTAIKVLFEHKRGLTVAVYLPFENKLSEGYVFGEPFTCVVESEVGVWADGFGL